MGLADAVQDVADQPAGEHAVFRFGDGAQSPGQSQLAGDGLGQLHGRRGDEPDLLAGVEVHLCQCARALPDLVGDDLVVDLVAEGFQFRGLAAFDERQGLAPAGGDVVAVLLAGHLELGLRVREPGQVGVFEVVAGGQAAGEVHQRRSVHQRVVDVEERGRGEVGRRRSAGAAGSSVPDSWSTAA